MSQLCSPSVGGGGGGGGRPRGGIIPTEKKITKENLFNFCIKSIDLKKTFEYNNNNMQDNYNSRMKAL